MCNYDYLLLLREDGVMDALVKRGLLGYHYYDWMDLYAYHLTHPKASQWDVSQHFNCSKKMVYKIYLFMSATK